ncbi:MAG: DVUA0089 family protein [Pirellulaceae bacterium]|nr:DVUA0089 family protein [Pirellulaceae bacterium]
MATQRSLKRLSALKVDRKLRQLARHKARRRLHLEHLEDRRVMAVAPPVFILPNSGVLLNNGDVRNVAPQDLTFRFTNVAGIDPATIAAGITLTRAGNDGLFGQANDVVITPGFIGLGNNNTEVIMRFAEPLPDDVYRVQVIGTGTTPLRDTSGAAFNGGVSYPLDFRLDLGAKVVAVVPQPVREVGGAVFMNEPDPASPGNFRSTRNIIHVYFNNDDLNQTSAQRVEFYRLYVTRNTLDPADDTEILPTRVEYDAALDKATLIFSQNLDQLVPAIAGDPDPARSLRLRIGTNESRRLQAGGSSQTVVTPIGTDPGSTFDPTVLGSAFDIGSALTASVQGSTLAFSQSIDPQPYDLDWPGGEDEPGHREVPVESHVGPDPAPPAGGINGLFDTVDGISTVFYNFRPDIGLIPNGRGGTQPAFNLITENEKQRAREVFDLYSKYSGIQFVETATSGLIVATGDLRVIDPTIPTGPGGVIGLAGLNTFLQPTAVMDNADFSGTGQDLYGQSWFQTAMHEIGHLLGQGHTYDLPDLTIQGSDPALQFNSPGAEPVFPGDADILHMQHMYRPEGKDIDMYRFTLDGTGTIRIETFAERLANSSNLDTALRLYQVGAGNVITEIARNDDYYSKDSQIELTLGPGTYYVGVSAAGNDKYDPTIVDSGMGGTTQGAYQLKFDFRKSATESIVDANTQVGAVPDTQAVAFDGDSDGNPGGVHNFWFRAADPNGVIASPNARVLFVDKLAPLANNTAINRGTLAAPYNNIAVALADARPFDIVRIVGNDPVGNDGGTAANRFADNLAYRIGVDDLGRDLADGAELTVPKDVTVMIDAGAIFQMRRSDVSVGSTDPSSFSDRSGGALQILGIPGRSVFFTSYNETGANSIGSDTNPFNNPPTPGDWGGISFKNDIDRADGRFDAEKVGVFLNYVNHADIRYGGGQVRVNSNFIVVNPIDMINSRPTVSNNRITFSADAAMAANPDSFEETNFQAPFYFPTANSSFTLDYDRVGPEIHGNFLVSNATNGLFVRTRTPAGNVLEELTIAGRFDDTDIVHVVQENLVVRGTPGGPILETVAPPLDLVVTTPLAGSGNFAAGAAVEYVLTYIDLLGNEGPASATLSVPGGVAISGSAILLSQLPDPTAPNSDYVARRLYRRINGAGQFTLVDQIPASVSEYIDTNAPTSGVVQVLKVGGGLQRPRQDASLFIDPSIVVKFDGSRIEVDHGANLIAEGLAGQEVVFTSLADDRYGAGGTFDTKNDNNSSTPKTPLEGDWGGIFFASDSKGSIDHAVVAYAGGLSRIEGNFSGFNAVEIHQAVVRVANSKFEFNDDGTGGQGAADRAGRGPNATAMIFIRGAQPVILNNIAISNSSAFINVNANALNTLDIVDSGRMSGLIDREPGHQENNGPLISGNKLRDNDINGMVVRGATLTTETVWDDTGIVHVLRDAINVTDLHTLGGLRLESSATESLVVKSSGATAGFTATGRPLEINDRIGGTIQVLGQPGFPVVLTSLTDDTAGAGTTPEGVPQVDTDNNGVGGGTLPTIGEVNNGVLIDNDTTTNTVGHFEFRVGPGGIALTSGVTAQGQSQLFINQDFIFDFLNYVDAGPNGLAIPLNATTITTPPTLISPDLVVSEGTFPGANGIVNWRVETTLNNGQPTVFNTLILNSTQPFGALRFINYLDEDVLGVSDDLLYQVGSPGQANFRLFTLDNAQRVGFSQGGTYTAGPGLVNATYDGFAADRFADLRTAIQGPGTTYSPTGNIDTVDLPAFTDPALGVVNGLADITTAMAWTINPTATTATITTFLELVATAPVSAGRPGEWQGITIDQYANDRNVETILEQEAANGDGLANAVPQKGQYLGALAPNEKSGDENLRLGFTVHGLINQPSDVDVYSFQAQSGTEVWIDFDRTTIALDSVVELVNNSGVVLARSTDSTAENAGADGLTGLARKMQKSAPSSGQDFFTVNIRDAGMRVILPGPANTTSTYFLRVRSATGVSVVETTKGAPAGSSTPAVNEIQQVSIPGATAGTFALTFNGQSTVQIAYNASAGTVQSALEALSNIAVGDVTVTGGSGNPWNIEFRGAYAAQDVPLLQATASSTLSGTGITSGQYQMQVRLREIDEFGGSTVRFAKIANAVNGIRVLGQPTHSPLGGEQSETTAANNTLATAQTTGNLLTTDRGNMAIAGFLSAATDVDWYRFDIGYQATQNALPPTSPSFWNTIFDMDYTDGLARPNSAFYVFDSTGRLILTSRDSNVADDQPGPAPGSGISDLTRGSAGGADPYIGTIAMQAGIGTTLTYYVAVSSDAQLPAQLDQFFTANATSPLFRLEPISSVERIVEDHVSAGITRGTSALPQQTQLVDANSAVPFNLGDVVMYINMSSSGNTERTQLVTVDPFTGENETDVGIVTQDYDDIAFSFDNRLFALTRDTDDPNIPLKDAQSGNYLEINTGTGVSTNLGDDGVETYDGSGQISHLVGTTRHGYGIQYNALAFTDVDGALAAGGGRTAERLLAVGNRGDATFTTPAALYQDLNRRRNIAYSLNPTNGQALVDGNSFRQYTGLGDQNSFTDAFELGEILTAPRMTVVREATDAGGLTGFAFTDGQTFDIQTDNATFTYEFDAGFEVQQNLNFSTNDVVRDGYFFILDPDNNPRTQNEVMFQFDTGVVLGVPLGTFSNAIPDGATFTVNSGVAGGTRTFEFDNNGQIGGGNIAIDIQTTIPGPPPIVNPPFPADVIASKIAAAINSQTNAGNFQVGAVVATNGTRISLVSTAAAGVAAGQISANVFSPLLTAAPAKLVREGETGLAPVLQAIDPAQVNAGELEGLTFTLTPNITGNPLTNPTLTFEFSADAVLAQPASNNYIRIDTSGIPVVGTSTGPLAAPSATTSSVTLAQRIASAVNNRAVLAGNELPISATQLSDRVLINGSGMVTNTTAYNAGTAGLRDLASGVANGGLQTIAIDVEENMTATQIGQRVANGFNGTTGVNGSSNFTAGADFDRINFPLPLLGAAATKVGTQGIDISGVPVWSQINTSAPGVADGRLSIRFLADDTEAVLANRIGNTIDNDLLVSDGIDATVFSNSVDLSSGTFVLPPAGPPTTPPTIAPLQVAGAGPGGDITGIWDITPATINTLQRSYLAVSSAGGLYVVLINYENNANLLPVNSAKVNQVITRYIGSSSDSLAGLSFQGLTRGPQNVEGGRYQDTFFAVADGAAGPGDQSRLYAFNFDTTFAGTPTNPGAGYAAFQAQIRNYTATDEAAINARFTVSDIAGQTGGLQPIFVDGATSIPLFYTDTTVSPPARVPVTNAKGVAFSVLDRNLWHITGTRSGDAGHGVNAAPDLSRPASAGGSSYFFGNDNTTPFVGNTYNFPGGAYGTLVTNEFNLTGYSALDQPVLYFNYFSAQEQNGIHDSFRVFISGVSDANRDGIPDNNPGEWTRIAEDATNIFVGTGGWRQVRIQLDNFVGLTNVRLRFDFSTAGDMNTGDTNTTGDELRAVKGEYIRDANTFSIDGQTFEFEGDFLLTFPSGAVINDGETFTITDDVGGVETFEFDKNGILANPLNTSVAITSTMTPDEVVLAARDAVFFSGLTGVTPRMLGGHSITPNEGFFYFDGDTFTINDGTTPPLTFEFEDIVNGPAGVAPGNVAVPFSPAWNQARIAQQIVDAIKTTNLQVTPKFEAPGQVLVENSIEVIDPAGIFQDVRLYTRSNILQFENTTLVTTSAGSRVILSGNDGVTAGNISVPFNIGQRAVDIASTIDGRLENAFRTPQITVSNGSSYQDGQVFTFDDGVGTVVTGEIETGYIINMPSAGGSLTALPTSNRTIDGETITIGDGVNTVTFQFRNTSLPVPAPIGTNTPVDFQSSFSKTAVARALEAAINASVLNVTALTVANSNLQIDTTGNAAVTYVSNVAGKYTTTGTPDVTPGNVPVLVSATAAFSASQVVASLITALTGQIPGVTPATTAGSVNVLSLNGADPLTFTFTVPTPQPGGLPTPPISLIVTNSIAKQDRDLLRIIGHTVTNRGPLGLEVVTAAGNPLVPLVGDVSDLNDVAGGPAAGYRSIERGQNNNFEGIYIDDFIIGLAERGEMGTNSVNAAGSTNSNFATNPQLNPNQILVGAYQLEIRRAPTYEFVNIPNPGFTPTSNDRFVEGYTIDAPSGANLVDGQTFTLSDGINRVTFEFDELALPGNPALNTGVIQGNQRIPFSPNNTADQVASAIVAAINSAQVQATLKLLASLSDGSGSGLPSRVNVVGPASTTIHALTTLNATEVNPTSGNDTIATAVVTGFTGSQYFIQGTIGDNPVLALDRATQGQDVDLFSFVVSAAQAANPNYRVRIDIDAQSFGSTLDSVLRIFDAAGNQLAATDDSFAPGEQQPGELTTLESYLEFDPTVAGTYYVGVSGFANTGYNPNVFGTSSAGSVGWYQLELTSALPSAVEPIVFTEPLGDWNHFRDQGQILLFGNEIRGSSQWGILIDSGTRVAADGNAPHQGPPRNLRELNTTRQVPGVVVMNNTIYDNVVGGILFSGDAAADAAVPFGRIVNNTLYGRGGTLTGGATVDTGISVTQNAAPTLLNNIVANFRTGVNVDATSVGLSVLGGMLYQGNTTNSNVGLGGDFPIALTNAEPLFVAPQVGNFYLRAQSRAIDSAVDSVLSRTALDTMLDPLGIARSPILSPDRDGVGQLRVNDPDVGTPQGFGLNPFKDRGAIDRVDFVGPTSLLVNPQDNDSSGIDLDPASTVVVLSGQTVVNNFQIRLLDRFDPNGPSEGSDVDDFTVTSSKVTVEVLTGTGATLLTQGVDYAFTYDSTNNIIILTPLGGLWPPGQTYRVRLDNSLTGIADRAGNILLPNQTDGTHTYTIFLGSAQDWGDLPDETIDPTRFHYPTLNAGASGVGASHQVVPGYFLGASIGAEADGVPSLNADADLSDDGLVSFSLRPGEGNVSNIVVNATFPATGAKLDVWLDMNLDGDFSDTFVGTLPGEVTSEYIISGATLTNSGGAQTFTFALPSGASGVSFLRMRLSAAGISTPTGAAPEGEVEDYKVTLQGPQFNNGLLPGDVNNDGVVNPLDVLTVVNFMGFLRGQLIDPIGGQLTLSVPMTSPPYINAAAVTFDPTGGGVPGQGKFIDVSAPFGLLTPQDILGVLGSMGTIGSGGEGEGPSAALPSGPPAALVGGEGEAPAVPAGGGDKRAALQSLATGPVYASSSVVLEQRPVRESRLPSRDWKPQATAIDLSFVDAEAAPAWIAAADVAERKFGPLEESEFDDLLGDLAYDVGLLPGETSDSA